jgi:2-hydroxychromene-2-carboxylate isomerase
MSPTSASGTPVLEFWFEFASTYSYLAAMRVEETARQAGVVLRWRPFLLGPLFRDVGWNDSPFNLYPAKGRYMWRDMERRAASHGLPFARPSIFPQNGLTAARVASAADAEPWLPEFVRSVYRANFAEGRDISEVTTIEASLAAAGAGPGADGTTHWIERARHEDVKLRLREATQRAMRLGIFGAPSFLVEKELFWGDDRLDDALAFALGSNG